MTRREELAAAADFAAQERAGAVPRNLGVISPGILHVWNHPVHGEPVVFLPGELLPPWAAARLVAAGLAEGGEVQSKPGDVVLVAQ